MVYRIVDVESTPFTLDRDKVIGADYFKENVSSTPSYFLGIDLDNAAGAGPYKHSADGYEDGYAIVLVATSGILIKESPADEWDAIIGTILEIDASQATIGFLQPSSLHARDTGRFIDELSFKSFPVLVNLKVNTDGEYENIAAGFIETTNSVNTGITLDDVSGTGRVPGVGDLIIKAERQAGSGDALLHYSLWYFIDREI